MNFYYNNNIGKFKKKRRMRFFGGKICHMRTDVTYKAYK